MSSKNERKKGLGRGLSSFLDGNNLEDLIDSDSYSYEKNSNTGINLESLSDKVLEAVKTTLVSELKTLTDANSATLSSTSTTFTNILLANESISDITTYLTNEVAEDITLYSPVLKGVVALVDEYVTAARGTKDIEASVKIDGVSMAKDFAAIINAFNALDLTNFTSTGSDALKAALIDSMLLS